MDVTLKLKKKKKFFFEPIKFQIQCYSRYYAILYTWNAALLRINTLEGKNLITEALLIIPQISSPYPWIKMTG